MSSNLYEKKVREVAESITRIMHVTAYNDRNKSIPDSNYWHIKVSGYEDAARAMVAEMKKMHYQGYITGLAAMEQFPEDCETNIDRRTQYFHSAAVRRGLISNTKTDNDA